MKYNLHINQKQAMKLGIQNINQAHIFDLLSICAVWADPIVIDDSVYYWVARQTISKELEILNLKPDTVYRHLKSLHDLDLIEYKKSGKKDCIKITKKGKNYHSDTMSEINPNNYVGNKSENNSEINPTYHTTNTNHNIKKNKQKKDLLIDQLKTEIEVNETREKLIIDFIAYRKTIRKPIHTTRPLKDFLMELSKIVTMGYKANEAIDLMKVKEWQTIKLDWVEKNIKTKAVSSAIPGTTFYEQTIEQKQQQQNKNLNNIAAIRKLQESGEI